MTHSWRILEVVFLLNALCLIFWGHSALTTSPEGFAALAVVMVPTLWLRPDAMTTDGWYRSPVRIFYLVVSLLAPMVIVCRIDTMDSATLALVVVLASTSPARRGWLHGASFTLAAALVWARLDLTWMGLAFAACLALLILREYTHGPARTAH